MSSPVPPYLGPRAALLLGLLVGKPRTVEELSAIANDGVDRFLYLVDEAADQFPAMYGSAAIALRSLADSGPEELRRLLLRLEEFGLAGRLAVDEAELWHSR